MTGPNESVLAISFGKSLQKCRIRPTIDPLVLVQNSKTVNSVKNGQKQFYKNVKICQKSRSLKGHKRVTESHRKVTERSLKVHQKVTERSPKGHRKGTEKSPKSCRKVNERSSKGHQKVTERSPKGH